MLETSRTLEALADRVLEAHGSRSSRAARAAAIGEAILDHEAVDDLFLDDDALAASPLCD